MENKTICFIVCAYKLQKSIVSDFLSMNKSVFESNNANVRIVCDPESKQDDTDAIRFLTYPIEQTVFNFSKTINYGIRNSLQFDIIAKIDIDIYLSDGVVKQILQTVNEEKGLVCYCADCVNIDWAKKLETEWPQGCKIIANGYGALFALYKSSWEKVQGYNEDLFGWGSEDRNMFDRSKSVVSMVASKENPLFHIRHKKRQGVFFPYRSGENGAICKRWDYCNPNWGIPV